VQWSVPDLTRTSLLYVDGHFIMLGEYGDLTLWRASPEKYEPVARVKLTDPDAAVLVGSDPPSLLRYPCWSAPILSHGLLYVRGDDQLVCLELIPDQP
jgi:hypothetical protein